MERSFSELVTPQKHADRYVLDVPAGWRQGRGAYGGFVVAALLRAIEHAVGNPMRAVRSVTAELPAPVASKPAEISVEILRGGKHVTTARAALRQEDVTCAHAVAVLAGARPAAAGLDWQDFVAPRAPAWDTLPAVPHGPMFPEFAQHFEYRLVEGLPGTGATQTLGWVKPRIPAGRRDAAFVAAMADVWFPVALARLKAPRPMATIAYTLDLVHGLDDVADDAPLLHRATAPVLTDGYLLETRELWTPDGHLVAINHQTFVVIA